MELSDFQASGRSEALSRPEPPPDDQPVMRRLTGAMRRLTGAIRRLTGVMRRLTGAMRRLTGAMRG